MIAESSAVYADFGILTHLRKKDGSVNQECLSLYDEADTEYSTEHGSVRSKQPQITVPASCGQGYGEGDFIDRSGKTYEILDDLNDGMDIVFAVSQL